MTVSKHPITRFLPSNVSNSDTRLKSCGTTPGMKGSNDAISNPRDCSTEVSVLPFTSDNDDLNAYLYAHPQGGGSSQPNRHLRARPLILQEVGENLPDPSVICGGTVVSYPLSDEPRNTTLYDAVSSIAVERVSHTTIGHVQSTYFGSEF